jgi:acyl dehydratase
MRVVERNFESVKVGSEIPSEQKGPITTMQMVRWAAGSGDFNPIHYDKDFALSAGLPSVIMAGPMKAAMLAHFLCRWAGSLGSVRSMECRYRGMDVPGNTLIIGGKVTEKIANSKGGWVVCEVWTENQNGEVTTTGTARILLEA